MGILDAPAASKKDFDKTARRRRRLLDFYNTLDRVSVASHEDMMATPPTVTIGTVNAASVLTLPRDYNASPVTTTGAPVVPPFRSYGGKVGVVTSTAVSNNGQLLSAASSSTPFYVDWNTDAPSFEVISTGGTSGNYRMRVDGLLVSAAVTTSSGTAGTYRDLYAFGSRRIRRIEIEASNNFRFKGVCVTTADAVMPSYAPIGPRVVWAGDSYAAGVGATSYLTGMVPLTCRTLGWKDVYNAGVGGVGYLTDGGGASGKTKLLTRLANDVYQYTPDIVVVQLGYNDTYFTMTPSAVTAEALACYTDIKSNLPNCTLIVVGHLSMQNASAGQIAMAAAIDSAVSQAGSKVDLYIKAIGATGGDWVDSTAQIPTYRHADGIHPTQDGHYLLAQRITGAIRAALPIG
jgi:lysophospholipase L1-like esterase